MDIYHVYTKQLYTNVEHDICVSLIWTATVENRDEENGLISLSFMAGQLKLIKNLSRYLHWQL